MKKQRVNNSSKHNFCVEEFSADELEVAEFLPQIGQLFLESYRLLCFLPSWRAKRKRSAIAASPTPPLSCPVQKAMLCDVESSSPATPLSFPLSESDYKSRPSKRKTIKKMSTEDLKKHASELTDQRETLRMEIKRVREFYQTQKILNIKLKQFIERPLEERLIPKEGNLNLNFITSCVEPAEPTVVVPTSAPKEEQAPIKIYRPDPYIINNQTAGANPILEKSKYPFVPMPPSFPSSGVCVDTLKESNPHGLPDLNIAIEENTEMGFPQQFDVNDRATASAQARKRRYDITREKRSMASVKLRG